jgi:hypothetical protein
MKFKLTFLTLFAVSLCTLNTNAQSFVKGDNVINLTIGFGSGVYTGSGYTNSPAFGFSMEHCFFDELINGDFSVGIGGFIGYSTSKYRVNYLGSEYGWNYSTFAIAGRGTFHWTGVEKLDTYAGVNVGGKIVSSNKYGDFPGTYSSSESGGGYFAPFVGARYYFSEAFCGVAEIGSGIGYMNIGVGFKF